MELKSIPSFDEFINESHHSTPIKHKGKTYYVNTKHLEDKDNIQVFVFDDPKLEKMTKVNGKTLMFKIADIEDKLKK